MTTYSYADLVALAQQSGFSTLQANVIAAIALAESGGRSNNYHINTDGSIDRGILQINSYYHSEVSDSCAYDPVCSFQQAYRISGGANFSEWETYKNGDYKNYLPTASTSNPPSITGGGYSITSLNPLQGIQDFLDAVTKAPIWGWLQNPTRFIKMVGGLLLIIVALLLLFLPDGKKVLTNVGKGKLSAALNTVD